MEYQLRKPSHTEADRKYPALYVMHGMGSNEQDLLSLVDGLEEHFYIFSIRGHLQSPPGFAFFTIEGFGKPHRHVFDQATSKVASFIDAAVEEYPIDQKQIYLLGFSQGAILSMTLGLSMGNKIKGIVALSGYIPDFVKENQISDSVNQISLFISHGEMDQVLPYEWGLANTEFFKEAGADVVFNSYPSGHTVTQQNYQDFRKWLVESLQK